MTSAFGQRPTLPGWTALSPARGCWHSRGCSRQARSRLPSCPLPPETEGWGTCWLPPTPFFPGRDCSRASSTDRAPADRAPTDCSSTTAHHWPLITGRSPPAAPPCRPSRPNCGHRQVTGRLRPRSATPARFGWNHVPAHVRRCGRRLRSLPVATCSCQAEEGERRFLTGTRPEWGQRAPRGTIRPGRQVRMLINV